MTTDAISVDTTAEGDGRSIPTDGDEVTVHYVGRLLSDGSMFDSSRKKKMPFVFRLGSGAVIKGWEHGIAQMSLGQRVKLKIASEAAYGAAGCTDTNASGTGVIPPHSDLLFDVELLDINHKKSVAALAKYRLTLDAWVSGKLEKYDASAENRAAMEAKHAGGREGYATHLAGVIASKYEAERLKRLKRTAPAAVAAADIDGSVASVSIADGGQDSASKQPAAELATAEVSAQAPAPLRFDARFATFKVEPNDEGEGQSPNFPRNLHNAAEVRERDSMTIPCLLAPRCPLLSTHCTLLSLLSALAPLCSLLSALAPPCSLLSACSSLLSFFSALTPLCSHSLRLAAPYASQLFAGLGHTDAAARLHACVSRNLATLEAGPDGKSAQRLGRACVCWNCGHVGLPSNAARCSEKGARPAGVCAGCGEDGQTNFLRVVAIDGKALPWIEHAPLTSEQEAKADEARAAAAAAEVN